jgi:hypothetical protein
MFQYILSDPQKVVTMPCFGIFEVAIQINASADRWRKVLLEIQVLIFPLQDLLKLRLLVHPTFGFPSQMIAIQRHYDG